MSHWKTFKNEILKNTKQDLLRKALQEMGLDIDMTKKSITNAYGNSEVDMAITKNGQALSLGFKEIKNPDNTTTLEIRGDFFNTGINEATFMDKLSQTYTKYDVIDKIENQTSYTIDGMPTVNENGDIEIFAYTFA